MHHDLNNLYATKAVALCSCGPFGHVKRSPLANAIQSRGPWLSGALCCRSGSSLNMASSEAVCPFRCLIFFVHRIFALRPRMGWNRQIPQFALRICDSVPSSVPRRPCRVHLAVTSSTVIAFALFAQARQPQIHARRFSRGCVTRLRSSLNATARNLASPSPARTFTTELSPGGSPQSDVGYNYTAKQPITAAGLAPARYAALWAAGEAARVLKPGDTCAFTVWQGPEKGNDFFRLILGTYQTHAEMEVGLPPAPPMFALADPAIRNPILTQAGFGNIHIQDLPIEWPLRGPETAFEFVLKGAVRTRMLYERQTPDVQQRIREALITGAMPYVRDGKAGIPCPAVLVTARKTC